MAQRDAGRRADGLRTPVGAPHSGRGTGGATDVEARVRPAETIARGQALVLRKHRGPGPQSHGVCLGAAVHRAGLLKVGAQQEGQPLGRPFCCFHQLKRHPKLVRRNGRPNGEGLFGSRQTFARSSITNGTVGIEVDLPVVLVVAVRPHSKHRTDRPA